MSDEEVKKVEATENDANTKEKKDKRSFKAKAAFAAKRTGEKLKKLKEKGKEIAKDTVDYVTDHAASATVKVATVATLAGSMAPTAASAATPNDHEDGNVTWVNGQNPNESTIALEMPDGTVLDGSNGIGAQPVKDLPRYKLGGQKRTASFTYEQQRMSASQQQGMSSSRQQRQAVSPLESYAQNWEASHPGKILVVSELSPYVTDYGNPMTGNHGYCGILEEYDTRRPALSPKFHVVPNDFYNDKVAVLTIDQIRTPSVQRKYLSGGLGSWCPIGHAHAIGFHAQYSSRGFGFHVSGLGRRGAGRIGFEHRHGQTTVSVGGAGRHGAGGITVSTGKRGTSVSMGGFTIRPR